MAGMDNDIEDKKPRKKRTPHQKAKDELDTVFSQFIRLRDADENGYVKCATCNVVKFWEKEGMQNGHYRSRQHSATRFEEKNCSAQCDSCNRWKDGMKPEHAVFLEKQYGFGILQELEAQSETIFKLELHWMLEKIEYYQSKVDELRQQKGI